MHKKYDVTVTRREVWTHTFEVEADSVDDAFDTASSMIACGSIYYGDPKICREEINGIVEKEVADA